MLGNFKKSRKHNSKSVVVENSVKALLVGINYRATRNELGGCINDVLTTRSNILSEYPNAYVELITDDTLMKPTRSNILNRLKILINTSKPGDILMFHYSGLCSQIPDFYGDEEDSTKETICPIDFIESFGSSYYNQISYDKIHNIILNVPTRVKFLMLSDCCRSDAIRDLKYDPAHYDNPNNWSYLYDPTTGTHTHNSGGGKKLTLNMCSRDAYGGGKLRIMSGCEENQNTGKDGVCTIAFWKTVQDIGGLHNFFPKLFSNNIEDLKYMRHSINSNVTGYWQRYMKSPTVLHWEHANYSTTSTVDRHGLQNQAASSSTMPFYNNAPTYLLKP